jgi:hypothetical protein
MRTIEQFCDHVLKTLTFALKRPQFFSWGSASAEQHFRHVLSDLCFIHEREGDATGAISKRWGARMRCVRQSEFRLCKRHLVSRCRARR